MADLKNARSAARNKATAAETKASEKKTRAPKPREEGTDASTTQEEATQPDPIALIVVAPNPKRVGSASHGFYEKYGKHGVLTDLDTVRTAGVRGKDISWDAERRHILLDNSEKGEMHATEFSKLETREEQAEFLKKLGVQEKNLIKWGYMDEPKAEEPAAEEAKSEEKADA